MQSISFDRAANTYDGTRGFPAGIGDLVAEAAIEMGIGQRTLEVGIGTGRIARPLLARGVRITGVDLSPKMMGQLLEGLPAGSIRPTLMVGDAVSLPLAASTFDSAIMVHVFHLIANWRATLTEIRRVLKPGGVFLTGYDRRPDDTPGALILEKWREITKAHGFDTYAPGSHDFADVKAELLRTGATTDERAVGKWTRTRTLAEHLETIEHRTWSSTWNVPDDFFPRCLAELRGWAISHYGGLDSSFTVRHKFIWQAFRWE